ncbi:hypothetical protein ABZX56_30595 [Streptomyces parvulus]|uniref:hypothetical protein n=1 Tax=Streptomyces TaxID=1883 RepID=UPI0033B17F64
MSRRPGFPHRVTLDLTTEQFAALNDAVDTSGGSMADYMRALIELHQQDPRLAERTVERMHQVRAHHRQARRARGKAPSGPKQLKIA